MMAAASVIAWNEAAAVWDAAIDRVAGDLLVAAGVRQPPVDALGLARRLGLDVAVDDRQSGRGRILRIDGRPAIFLRSDDRPERMQWAAAHELGEFSVARVCAAADAELGDVTPRLREQLANWFAARLLLPAGWFHADARRGDGDLLALKGRYRSASHELIALRLLDLDRPAIATVFDHGRMTRRRSNLAGGTPPLQPIERRAQGDAHRLAIPVSLEGEALQTRAWPIHEPEWKREIIVTTLAWDGEWDALRA